MPLHVGLDATPLISDQRSGVGRYVEGLLTGLADLADPDVDVVCAALSLRGGLDPTTLPYGRVAPRRLPARLLRTAWRLTEFPPIEMLTGPLKVVHGSNFVLPGHLPGTAGVVAIHDLTYLRFPGTVTTDVLAYRDLVPRSLKRCNRVVVGATTIRDEVLDAYGQGPRPQLVPEMIHVIPHGVGPAWLTAQPLDAAGRTRLGLPERYLLFVGSLEPRKNLRLLLDAHVRARRERGDVPPLVLVGPSGWGDRWAGGPPDPADVVLAGYLDQADLERVVAGAVAVCLPSRYEGFGLPLLEGLACGRPVVASDIGAHREVSGGLATLVPLDDLDGWTSALVDVSTSAPESAAAQARQDHAATFTWRRSAEQHVGVWRAAFEMVGQGGAQ